VDTTLTDERQQLIRSVAGFLDKRSPEAEVRRLMEAGGAPDPGVWSAMAGLGLQGLVIPESYGGGGFGYLDLTLVLEQMGEALLVSPFLSTVMAAAALLESDDDSLRSAYLPSLAAGERVGTLALAEDSGRWDAASIETVAQPDADRYRLSGTKSYVIDGQYADVIVVSARSPMGRRLFVVDADSQGVTVTPLRTLDATRPQARIEFSSAEARILSRVDDGRALVEHVVAIAGICLAAEQVGGAQRCLDMAVSYAKTRVQFDRPIGSFQAIKHKCADMLVAVESARSAVYHAAATLDDGDDPVVVSTVAAASCSQAYTHVAGENIQIHGGIGFTWDHPAQLYFKRAKSSEMLFGDPAFHRERLACLIGI
jgi:alkylation response protein AidB-like acyl-CoA dehydrogenase